MVWDGHLLGLAVIVGVGEDIGGPSRALYDDSGRAVLYGTLDGLQSTRTTLQH